MCDTVAIVLPLFNGEKYVDSQISSIEQQTYQDWKIYVRDDGSTDSTTKKIRKLKEKLGNKLHIVDDKKGHVGVNENIFLILDNINEKYIMFSDQDDYWYKNKIEKSISVMKKYENKNVPMLVYSDSCVVDENLNVIANSFLKEAKFDIKRNDLCNFLQVNVVQGCTMLINCELKR